MERTDLRINIASIIISIFALGISGTATYYNLFRHERSFQAWIVDAGKVYDSPHYKIDVAFMNDGTDREVLFGARCVAVSDSSIVNTKIDGDILGRSFFHSQMMGGSDEERFIEAPRFIDPGEIYFAELTLYIDSTRIEERIPNGQNRIAIGLNIDVGQRGKQTSRNIIVSWLKIRPEKDRGGAFTMYFDLLSNKVKYGSTESIEGVDYIEIN